MMDISDERLTTREVGLLNELRSDCRKYSDMIIDHGCTGNISNEHVEEMIRSVKVCFVSRRHLYMNEFLIGLQSYGLDKVIKERPSVCEPLFVNGDLKNGLKPTADYLFSLMVPNYLKLDQQEDTQRKKSWIIYKIV